MTHQILKTSFRHGEIIDEHSIWAGDFETVYQYLESLKNDFANDSETEELEYNPGKNLSFNNNDGKYSYLYEIVKFDRILCAAVWFKGTKIEGLPLPTNIDRGIVIAGRRHNDCVFIYLHLTRKPITNYLDGFLTASNRFVDRVEALKIAKESNQLLSHIDDNSVCLISQMLYTDD
jgi:hypothetical protein